MIRKYTVVALLLTFVASSGAPALAQTDLSKFPLTKAIPSDAFIAVASKANAERKFLDDYWTDVHVAFIESGVLSDIWEMFTDSVDDEKLEMIENLQERFSALCAKVDWCELFSKEFIYAGRLIMPVANGTPYEGIVMGRMDGAKAGANYAALKALIAEFVKLVEADYGEGVLTITETNEDGVDIATLAHRDLAGVVLSVAHSKDVIALSFGGPTILNESMMLLQGATKKKGLVQSERFKKAFAELPPAEDTLVFFDPSMMFTRLGGMLKAIAASKEMKSEKDPQAEEASQEEDDDGKAALNAINKLLEDISIMDYVATVEYTEGQRVFTDSIATLKVDAKNKPLYDVLAGGKHSDAFARFIPQEADSFDLSSGINFKALYAYIRHFVEGQIPGGKEGFEEFDRVQKEVWQIDIEHDIINILEGPMLSYSAKDDWVVMFKVSDEKKMAKQVSVLLDKASEAMGENNALVLTPVKITGDRKFTQISHPMMMMMGGGVSPPVWGCAEGHLILGSSTKAIDTCLKTAEGKHPNITKNKRWVQEAIQPKSGSVDAISFTDETNFAVGLQQAIGGASMGLSMAGMFMAEAPPHIRGIIQGIPGILAKLGPVAGKLDFYQSSAEVTTFDGRRWTTKGVQNYKDPKVLAKTRSSSSTDDGDSAPEKASTKKPVKNGDEADEPEEDGDE